MENEITKAELKKMLKVEVTRKKRMIITCIITGVVNIIALPHIETNYNNNPWIVFGLHGASYISLMIGISSLDKLERETKIYKSCSNLNDDLLKKEWTVQHLAKIKEIQSPTAMQLPQVETKRNETETKREPPNALVTNGYEDSTIETFVETKRNETIATEEETNNNNIITSIAKFKTEKENKESLMLKLLVQGMADSDIIKMTGYSGKKYSEGKKKLQELKEKYNGEN